MDIYGRVEEAHFSRMMPEIWKKLLPPYSGERHFFPDCGGSSLLDYLMPVNQAQVVVITPSTDIILIATTTRT